MKNGTLRFDGQVKWCKGERILQWSARNWDATRGRLVESIEMAVFKSGNLATDAECKRKLFMFTAQRQRREQFQLVEQIIVGQLWPALIHAFGYPTMEYITE
jgi:hypothetical protein